MYFTAHGRVRSRAASRRFRCAAMTASRSATRPSRALREIWNGARLPGLPRRAAERRAAAGLRRLRPALEPVSRCTAAAGRGGHPDPQRGGGDRRGGRARSRAARSMRSSSSTAAAPTAPSSARAPPGARVVTETPPRLRAGLPRRRRGGRGLRHPRVPRRRRQRLPGADPALVAPIADGSADFVIGSRTRGKREQGSMSAHQTPRRLRDRRRAAAALRRPLYRHVPVPRDPARRAAAARHARETYGWNLEMQMRAARAGLRILEMPVAHRRRAGGVSKVSGNLSRHAQGELAHPADLRPRRSRARRAAQAAAPARR